MPGDGYTLDRIDHNLERYGPGLCRWATKAEQTRNRRNTRFVRLGDEEITLAEFADRVGKPYKTVHSALGRGVSPEALATGRTGAQTDGRYCPLRYQGDPDGLTAWYGKFNDWKRSVRKDYRRYARPEVYDIVKLGALYPVTEKWMARQGYFELTPDDMRLAEELVRTEFGHLYVNAVPWMKYAIACLAEDDPSLAASLADGPNPFRQVAHLDEELRSVVDEGPRRIR